MQRVLGHILCCCALIALALFAGAREAQVDVGALLSGADVVSSATEILDAPSGAYTILINRERHTDPEVLALWEEFLAGHDVPLIMEDVTCVTLEGDGAGFEMATSLASRLPANQMKVRQENAVLALSKAEDGRFDIMVMSDEAAAAQDLSRLLDDPRVDVVRR